MNSEQKRLVRIGLPFAPGRKEFPAYSLAKGSTAMTVSQSELEFLGRLSKQLNRSGSPVWLEVQPLDEAPAA